MGHAGAKNQAPFPSLWANWLGNENIHEICHWAYFRPAGSHFRRLFENQEQIVQREQKKRHDLASRAVQKKTWKTSRFRLFRTLRNVLDVLIPWFSLRSLITTIFGSCFRDAFSVPLSQSTYFNKCNPLILPSYFINRF